MSVRSIAQRVHRWAGIAIAAFIFMAGLTGAAIAFFDESDAWLNRRDLHVLPAASPLGIESLVALVESRYPQARVRSVYVGEDPDEAWVFNLRVKDKAAQAIDQVFVDPYKGIIRAERRVEGVGLGAKQLMPTLLLLHRSMLLGDFGKTLMGVVALLWLLSSPIGVALAWPASGNWRPVFSVKWDARPVRRHFELHRVIGLVSSLVMLIMSLSAVYLAFPEGFRAVVRSVSPAVEVNPRAAASTQGAGPATPEEAMRAAVLQYPGAVARGIVFKPDQGLYEVRVRLDGDINLHKGTGRVVVDKHTGRIVSSQSFRQSDGAGDTFVAWMFPLHSGQAFGTAGRLIIACMGLVAAFMSFSGVRLWWLRRQALKRGRAQVAALKGRPPTAA